jgi:hypothetical protein
MVKGEYVAVSQTGSQPSAPQPSGISWAKPTIFAELAAIAGMVISSLQESSAWGARSTASSQEGWLSPCSATV